MVTDTSILNALNDPRTTRRQFLALASALGIASASATSLWTGRAQAATPKRGGTLKVGIHSGNTSDTHDPGTYVTYSDIILTHTFRSYLTLINTDGTLGGDVATEWSAAKGATEWTFKLTDKAVFHSGRKVTANDVVASMNHHRGENTTSAAKTLLQDVTDIVDNGDNSVTFKLGSANADLPWLMTDYHLVIIPANADGTANWQSADGCGPYKLTNAEFGISFSLVRHDDWHLEGAYFDAVELLILNDPNARQTALVTGDVDAVTLIENKTLAFLQRDPNLTVENVPSASALTFPMLCDTAPFDNVDVRKALKLSVDRNELIEKITFGAATIGNDFHHSPAMPYWPDDIPQHQYDPDRAKSLLKKAGMQDLAVDLHIADNVTSGAVDMCVLYAERAKAAGIAINVIREPNDGYYSEVWLKKPWCVVSWGARPTPDVMYSLAYKEGAAWNESRWVNARFNQLLLQGKAETDDALRAEIYREMAQIARDDGGTVIPFFPNWVYARRANVLRGAEVAASWPLDGARGASRWWFDS